MSRRRLGKSVAAAAFLAVNASVAAQTPARIVATSPGITETLFALGLGEQVVGVSQHCRHPPVVLALPKVGTFLKPDVERIARLRPDLVIAHTRGDGLEGRLAAVGLRCAFVGEGEGLAGVYASIGAIAAAAGVPERGRTLAAELAEKLSRMRAGGGKGVRPRVLLIVGRRPGTLSDIVAVGGKPYLGELLAIAGGANVLAGPALPAYPRISLETVVRLRPDVLIDTGDMGDTPEDRARASAANLALWRESRLVRAAGIPHIHAATTDALVVPGPRMVEAAEWLRGLIQGGRAP